MNFKPNQPSKKVVRKHIDQGIYEDSFKDEKDDYWSHERLCSRLELLYYCLEDSLPREETEADFMKGSEDYEQVVVAAVSWLILLGSKVSNPTDSERNVEGHNEKVVISFSKLGSMSSVERRVEGVVRVSVFPEQGVLALGKGRTIPGILAAIERMIKRILVSQRRHSISNCLRTHQVSNDSIFIVKHRQEGSKNFHVTCADNYRILEVVIIFETWAEHSHVWNEIVLIVPKEGAVIMSGVVKVTVVNLLEGITDVSKVFVMFQVVELIQMSISEIAFKNAVTKMDMVLPVIYLSVLYKRKRDSVKSHRLINEKQDDAVALQHLRSGLFHELFGKKWEGIKSKNR